MNVPYWNMYWTIPYCKGQVIVFESVTIFHTRPVWMEAGTVRLNTDEGEMIITFDDIREIICAHETCRMPESPEHPCTQNRFQKSPTPSWLRRKVWSKAMLSLWKEYR